MFVGEFIKIGKERRFYNVCLLINLESGFIIYNFYLIVKCWVRCKVFLIVFVDFFFRKKGEYIDSFICSEDDDIFNDYGEEMDF